MILAPSECRELDPGPAAMNMPNRIDEFQTPREIQMTHQKETAARHLRRDMQQARREIYAGQKSGQIGGVPPPDEEAKLFEGKRSELNWEFL
jgi:hypothetical protein